MFFPVANAPVWLVVCLQTTKIWGIKKKFYCSITQRWHIVVVDVFIIIIIIIIIVVVNIIIWKCIKP
jgi:hypothetical protein